MEKENSKLPDNNNIRFSSARCFRYTKIIANAGITYFFFVGKMLKKRFWQLFEEEKIRIKHGTFEYP